MKRKKDGAQGAPGLKSLWEPAAYLLPFLIGLAVFVVYPFINVFLISFQNDYNMMTGAFDGFGVENYRKILADPNFLNGLRNTALYVVFVVPVSTAISLGIASMLNANIRLKGLFQTCYFLPMVTSITAVGLVWKWMFNYDYGLINYFLSFFGVEAINWLNDPKYNLAALILYGIWNMLPFTTILLLSGYQNIDRQYYTAARVEGAHLFAHYGAAAGAHHWPDADCEHHHGLQGVYRAVPSVQRQPRLGIFAVYGGVLPVRYVLYKVGAGPRGGKRRCAVCHCACADGAAAVCAAQMEELLR